MIPFNLPPYTGAEQGYIAQAVQNHVISGDGEFTRRCSAWLEAKTGCAKALLTTSCTHALEMAAFLADIRPGDEVVMPSYTFVSTANAFVLRGARIVFVDIRPDTMNIDEKKIEPALTPRTKAIVPVHYAGVACAMDAINAVAGGRYVIEDAAQAVMSAYKGRAAGALADFGCYSFHETKNLSMGEGGAILLKDKGHVERAEIIREKGTNRSKFFRGEIDKYSWVDVGSSYLPSELNAAYLYAQTERAEELTQNRLDSWRYYYAELSALARRGLVELPFVPPECEHNAHMFYIKVKDLEERTKLLTFLKEKGVHAVFHYIPLHSSRAGRQFGRFAGEDLYTTQESERLLRLPLYYGLTPADRSVVVEAVYDFFGSRRFLS
ncbi:MAG: dTDP-4-amino-4,6-dideoxygalactose transaminase [Gracilibacteraceae bacterium]|nr:dTDP-4-amino-4,6-dideoxygalactose transaminase [Gracilibacteraceae bacterium]